MKRLSEQTGMTLIEVLFAIAIFGFMLGPLTHWVKEGNMRQAQKAASTQMQAVADAASAYVKANASTLLATATDTAPVVVSTAILQAGGFLSGTFQGVNPWSQSYQVYINQPIAGDLRIVVLTSGGRSHSTSQPDFGNRVIPATAAALGAAGGFTPSGDIPGTTVGTLQGAYGGWQLPFAGTGIPDPGAGHLAYLLTFDDGHLSSDALYRVSVPGQPELNQMATTLDMNSNQILMGGGDVGGGDGEGVGQLNFEERLFSDYACAPGDDNGGGVHYDPNEGLYICRNGQKEIIADSGNSGLFQSATIASNGDLISKPTCPSTGPVNPKIYLAPVAYHDDSYALLRGVQTWATDAGTDWQVHIQTLTIAGWTNPAVGSAKIQVLTQCSP